MWIARAARGLVTVLRYVGSFLLTVLLVPLKSSVFAYRIFTRKVGLGAKRAWGEDALRKKYKIRRIEIGVALGHVAAAACGVIVWLLILWVVTTIFINREIVADGTPLGDAYDLMVWGLAILAAALAIIGWIMSFNEGAAVRRMEDELDTV